MIRPENNPNNLNLPEAAHFYAEHGLPVFPLAPGGKLPLTFSHGFKDATTDRASVEALWRKTPEANIGMPMGTLSGIVALDLDVPAGADSLTHLKAAVVTLTSVTARGHHILFKCPSQVVPTRAKLLPDLDLRGELSYIVVPPSVHPSGEVYRWDDEHGMGWGTPIARLPERVVRELEIASRRAGEGRFVLPATIRFPKGKCERQSRAFRNTPAVVATLPRPHPKQNLRSAEHLMHRNCFSLRTGPNSFTRPISRPTLRSP